MHIMVQSANVDFIVSYLFTAGIVAVHALVELGQESAQLDGQAGSELLCRGLEYEQTTFC
jgi:hypothetical protein